MVRLPVASLAPKSTILIGLLGQFYLVILTAIVVGKDIGQKRDSLTFKSFLLNFFCKLFFKIFDFHFNVKLVNELCKRIIKDFNFRRCRRE